MADKKGDALERRSYCGLKLTDQILKKLQRVIHFILRQLQEKYFAMEEDLNFGFVYFDEAFDRVLRMLYDGL